MKYIKSLGISLLEFLLVLAVTAAIMVYAVHYFSQVINTNRINGLVQQVGILYKAGVSYTNTLKYQTSTGTLVIQDQLVNGRYIRSFDLNNFWNKTTNVQVKLIVNSGSSSLLIQIPTLPTPICSALSTRLPAIYSNMTPITTSNCTAAPTQGLTLTFKL